MHILVVDDFGTMRRIVIGLLKELGFTQFTEAENGQQALHKFTTIDSIDFIITDWNMPVMTGLDLLKAVRAINKDIPVLLVTAEAKRENIIEAAQAGASGYVVKPFNATTLLEKINKIRSK